MATVLAAQRPRLERLATRADLRAWADELIDAHARGDHPVRCPLGTLAAELAEHDPAACVGCATTASRPRVPERLATALLAAYQGGLLLSQASGDLEPLRTALRLAIETA